MINISNFKAGIISKQFGYPCFCPNSIDVAWVIDNPEINMLLQDANLKLGALDAFSSFVPDVDLFVSMHVVKEATQSNKIEGTRTRIDEAVLAETDISADNIADWQEVQNYIAATNFAIKSLETLPISARLIKDTHRILLDGVRGTNKMPGNFRASQNWIGGATLADAAFVPPHQSLVEGCISDLEKYLNNDTLKVPHLIKIGMAHYQFEAIHPFLDGNGRMGRLLITLYLLDQKVLSKPTLYLSDFIEKHRQLYYDNLSKVSANDDIVQWLKFFLVGVSQTAESAIDTLKKIIALRDDIDKTKLVTLGKKLPTARLLLHYLYRKPVVSVAEVTTQLGVAKQTAISIIQAFVKVGILVEGTGKSRNRMYYFHAYLAIFL